VTDSNSTVCIPCFSHWAGISVRRFWLLDRKLHSVIHLRDWAWLETRANRIELGKWFSRLTTSFVTFIAPNSCRLPLLTPAQTGTDCAWLEGNRWLFPVWSSWVTGRRIWHLRLSKILWNENSGLNFADRVSWMQLKTQCRRLLDLTLRTAISKKKDTSPDLLVVVSDLHLQSTESLPQSLHSFVLTEVFRNQIVAHPIRLSNFRSHFVSLHSAKLSDSDQNKFKCNFRSEHRCWEINLQIVENLIIECEESIE
jgi:hypothetical protein